MNYRRLVPPDSFLGRYLKYMDTQETSRVFDWWCGLWCISSACGRAMVVARPRAPVYLNMFVILVGESGVARKTTSVNMAMNLVRPVLAKHNIGFMDAKATPEKLEELLMLRTQNLGCSEMVIACPELAVMLGTEQYIATMPVLFTDLYDCPAIRSAGGTVSRGTVILENVWLNLLSASTPVWLLKSINPNVIEGGFTSRSYFIVSNEPKRKIPWPEASDPTLFQDMRDDLHIIANEARTKRSVTLDTKAMTRFVAWYEDRPRSMDTFKQAFESREDAHVLRIAALLSINDGSFVIQRGHINVAVSMILDMKTNAARVFDTAELRTKFATGLDVIRSSLVSSGMDPILKSQLYNRVRHHMNFQEFNTLIEVMHEVRAIQRFEIRTGERGRPGEWIRGTDMILARGLGEIVLERLI